MPNLTVSFLQAFNGDCIFLSLLDNENIIRNILIDGGTGNTYETAKNSKSKREDGPLKIIIEDLVSKGQNIDLLILTHIDDDHIGGLLRWFSVDPNATKIVKEVWFNGGKQLSEYLEAEPNGELDIFIENENSTKTSFQQGVNFADILFTSGIWKKESLLIIAESLGLVFSFSSFISEVKTFN